MTRRARSNSSAERVWSATQDLGQFTGEVGEDDVRPGPLDRRHLLQRDGGTIEESDDPKATPGGPQSLRQLIVTYLPGRLLVLRNVSAPAGLPGRELYPTIVQIVSLEPLTDKETLVTLSGTGYGAGADYDRLYGFLREHNAAFLASLKTLCETPPAAGVATP